MQTGTRISRSIVSSRTFKLYGVMRCLPITADFLVFLAFHRKCIDPWLTKTKHTCPLCKKKVFRHAAIGDDSDSDSGSVENSSTNASERTPLLTSGAFSNATNTSASGTCCLFSSSSCYKWLLTSDHTESGIAHDHSVFLTVSQLVSGIPFQTVAVSITNS